MKDIIIDTPEALVKELNSLSNSYVYRGHSSEKWALESMLERALGANWSQANATKAEDHYLNVFKSKFHLYDKENVSPKSKLAWLSLMQHYGVPTRLLDFTQSPYVALYFALETYDFKDTDDLAIIAIDFTALLKASIDVIKTKDARFKEDHITVFYKQDEVYESFIDPVSLDIAWVTEPLEGNARLDRQAGSFLLSCNKAIKLEAMLALPTYATCDMRKLIIKRHLCKNVYALLRKMNINSKSIYGDLQGLGRSLKMEIQIYNS